MIAKQERRAFVGDMSVSAHKYERLKNLPHWHDEIELIHIDKGKLCLSVGAESYELNEGDTALIGSGEVHHLQGDENSRTSIIKIDHLKAGEIENGLRLVTPLLTNSYGFTSVYQEIIAELKRADELSGTVVKSIALLMLSKIFRNEKTTAVAPIVSAEKRRFKEIYAFVSENYPTATFKEVADLSGFSEPYFSQEFKRVSGMTFTRYLNAVRVNEAVKMLLEKDKSVTQISIECGFGTIRNFNRVFKSVTGYNPKSLPENYAYSEKEQTLSVVGFDPTLASTVILE